jgi:hypothetical protein
MANANDSQNNHDEVDLGAVLNAAQAAPAMISGTEDTASLYISDIIADYQAASSGYEVDLSALFDSIAGGETATNAGDSPAAPALQATGDVGGGIDLSALFDSGGETDGHIETMQAGAGLPADTDNGTDGFTTFTAVTAYPGAITALYGDDGHDHSGTSAG